MISKSVRYLRGLLGTALTWGMLWSAINTAALFARWLPNPPIGTTRAGTAISILTNQSVSALVWGSVLGALFGVALTFAAARWPSTQPLRPRRLSWIGALVGLGLGASAARPDSWFEVGATAIVAIAGAGVGAVLGVVAARAQRELVTATVALRLPSA